MRVVFWVIAVWIAYWMISMLIVLGVKAMLIVLGMIHVWVVVRIISVDILFGMVQMRISVTGGTLGNALLISRGLLTPGLVMSNALLFFFTFRNIWKIGFLCSGSNFGCLSTLILILGFPVAYQCWYMVR
jgi:hypothetical protein